MKKNGGALFFLLITLALVMLPYTGACADTALDTELVINGGGESATDGWFDESKQGRWGTEGSSSWAPAVEGSKYFFLYCAGLDSGLSADFTQSITLAGTEGSGLFSSIDSGNITMHFSLSMYQSTSVGNEAKAIIEAYSSTGSLLETKQIVNTASSTLTMGAYQLNTQLASGTRSVKITLSATLTNWQYAQFDKVSLKLAVAAAGSAPEFGSDFPESGTTDMGVTYTHAFTIADADTGDIDHLTFTASSSNIDLVPAANVTISGTGANRTLTIIPTSGLSGESDVTITASDGSKSADATIHLIVSKVISLASNLVENGNATSGYASWQGSTVNITPTGNGFSLLVDGVSMYQDIDISKFSSLIDGGLSEFSFSATFTSSYAYVRAQFYTDIACTSPVGNETVVNPSTSSKTGAIPAGAKGVRITFVNNDGNYHSVLIRNITFQILNNFPKIAPISAQTTRIAALTVPVYPYYATASATLSATSSDQSVVLDSSITAGGTGFTRSITFTPLKEGNTTISVIINDGTTTATQSFTVTVHEPAEITGVDMPSTGYYAAGGQLDFTVNFNRSIQGGNDSTLPLTIGGVPEVADYHACTANSITYRYTLGSSDEGTVSVDSAIVEGASKITDLDNFAATLTFSPGATGVTAIPAPAVSSTAAGNTVTYGTQVTFTVALTCPDTLTGTVQFAADGISIGSPVTLTANQASYQTAATALDAGARSITASYIPSNASCHFVSLPSSVYALSVSQKGLTVTGLSATDRVYDGTTDVTLSGGSLVGVLTGDTVSPECPTSGTAAVKDVGTRSVSFAAITLTGADQENYIVSAPPSVSVVISARPLSVTATVADKPYDGTTAATVTEVVFNNLVSGETLTAGTDYTATGVFESTAISEDIPVTVTVALLGTDKAANYALTSGETSAVADITRKALHITGVTATTRTYNGTSSVALSGGTLVGVETADVPNVGFNLGAGTLPDANAASGKAVLTAITLTGSAADSYALVQPTGITVTIQKAPLTLISATAADKAYDGSSAATVTDADMEGTVSGETLAYQTDYTATGVFASADVGTGKTVDVTATLSDTAIARNYTLATSTVQTTANITNHAVTISGVTATDRAYDGSVQVTLSGGTLSGVAVADLENVGFTLGAGTVATASCGSEKPVTTAIALTGAKASNYTLTQPTDITVDIHQAALSIAAAAVDNKPYDATTVATVTGVTFSGLAADESLTAGVDYTVSGIFASADTGADIGVTVTATLKNTVLANNYTISGTGSATASIQPLTLSGAVSIDITNGSGDSTLIDQGDELSVNTSGITVPGTLTVSCQWYRNGTEISSATATSYTVGDLTVDPIGAALSVTVRGTGNYTGTLSSADSTIYQVALGGSVSISGDTKYRSVLTLNVLSLTPAGATYTISWLRDGSVIDGATDAQYTITKPDQGTTLTAVVTAYGYFIGTKSADCVVPPSPYIPDKAITELTDMVTVDLTMGSTILSEEQLDMLRALNAQKPLVFGGDGYTITFPIGGLSAWSGDLNLGILFNTGTGYTVIRARTGSTLIMMLSFRHSGALPGSAQVSIFLGEKYAGQTLRYLYYNEVSGKLELLQTVLVDSNGYFNVTQDHCSSYAIARFATSDVPKTGDTSPVLMWWIIGGIAATGLIVTLFWGRKKHPRP